MTDLRIINADVMDGLAQLDDESVQCVVTSPPYWGLRDYGVDGQIGLEATPEEYISRMVAVFAEVRRALRGDGVLWLNLGDSYNAYNGGAGPSSKLSKTQSAERPKLATGYGLNTKTLKPKDMIGIPWRVALALQADGWYLRSDIIWHKPNPMPESVTDRPTKSHEYVFLMTKSARYFWDADAVAESSHYPGDNRALRTDTRKSVDVMCMDGGSRFRTGNPAGKTRNIRTVWTIPTESYAAAHFATFPTALAERCIRAGSAAGDTVLDPFAGSGTTLQVARGLGRNAIGIELNPEYCKLIEKRCALPWERAIAVDANQSELFIEEG